MKKTIGILGCASIAEKFIIPNLLSSDKFKLIGIASRDMSKATEFGDRFGIKPFGDYQELIDSKPDCIYIPLPNALHFEWVRKALLSDINVIVEKSLATSNNDVNELNNIAKKNDLVLFENFQFRFHKQFDFIKQSINNKLIGEVRSIRASFGFPPFIDNNNIRYKKELGGGALLDAGAYTIKISTLLLGNTISVSSSVMNYTKNHEVDIFGSGMLLEHTNKVVSQVAYGFDNHYQNCLEIWGSDGVLVADRIFTAGPSIKAKVLVKTSEFVNEHTFQDNHFENMINYFYGLLVGTESKSEEYKQNLKQSQLLAEFIKNAK
ncbi:Gfo/Idh/MocA family protein [Shewanella kaireitica]|uniref:Gfo/Idh/MocA family protein n=1 Tax=Shewanella kaireitica TaxID=212021 RepID=UPI00200DBA9A|nr:Gfo/Idh/MocA family oxidoreductase [Shewanella kaireitica]MCL1093804.1 Gfo/Idh/MocA family oxidoreductase [Shewanella kaireitica]